jgi:hypothetical protein
MSIAWNGKHRADFTAQDVFDFTIDHLYRQRWKAIDDYGYFRHRSHGGARSCAVGVHMEDSEYDEIYESVGVDIVVDGLEPSLPLAQHLDAHLGLFLALQEFHDNEEIEDFSSPEAHAIVRKIASDFRLNADHIDWLYVHECVVQRGLEMEMA